MKDENVGMDVLLGEYFSNKVWFTDFPGAVRLVGISIKVEPGGCLGVLKAVSAEGPKVAFLGASSIDSLWRKLRDPSGRAALQWREDKYRFDKNDQVG